MPETRRTASADSALLRAVGVWGLAAAICNVTIGGGIFRLPASVAATLGAAAPLAYLVCALAFGLIVLCFAEAGSRVELTGGPYAYVGVAFGPFAGFLAGFFTWLLGTFAFAAVSTVFIANLGQLVPAVQAPGAGWLVLALVLALFCTINVLGVRQGSRVNAIATVAKLLPLVLLAAVGLFFVRGENLRVEEAPSMATLSRTVVLLVFAFSGVESALVPSGEVRDPARTVPRALAIAMVAITVLYVLLQVVAQGVLGPDLATSSGTPLADAAGRIAGPGARAFLLLGATLSTGGYISGMMLAMPRALWALARDGFLPKQVAAVHPRFRTPHVAIALQGVVIFLLAASNSFERLAILSNIAVLALYAMCAAAAWELRRRDVRQGGTPFRVPAAGVVAVLAEVVILWILTSVTAKEWLAFGGVLGVVVVIYLLSRGRRAAMVSSRS